VKIAPASLNPAPIVVLYGHEGRGKTTLAAKFPKPVALLLERGLPRGVAIDAVEDVRTFEDIMTALRGLYDDPHGYQTLVIDTIDALEPMLIESVCVRNGWKTVEQPPFGKGWVMADDTWRQFLRGLTAIRDRHGMAICLVCHAEVVKIDDPRAPTYGSYQPKLHKRARALVMDAADAVLFLAEDLRIVTDGERTRADAAPHRFLFTEGRPAFAAKNRFAMPPKIAIPSDFDFGNLARYWANT